MRRTTSILLAGALFLVLLAGVAVAAQSNSNQRTDKTADTNATKVNSSANSENEQVLELESRPTDINSLRDLAGDNPVPGTPLVFSNELFEAQNTDNNRRNSSEKVGQAEGRCNVIDPAAGRLGCTIVSTFEDGTITSEGILVNKQDATSTVGVTGGTGAYRGVTGEGRIKLGDSPEDPQAIRFTLQQSGVSPQQQPEPASQTEAQQPEPTGQTEVKQPDRDP